MTVSAAARQSWDDNDDVNEVVEVLLAENDELRSYLDKVLVMLDAKTNEESAPSTHAGPSYGGSERRNSRTRPFASVSHDRDERRISSVERVGRVGLDHDRHSFRPQPIPTIDIELVHDMDRRLRRIEDVLADLLKSLSDLTTSWSTN
jgi:hypothetical protein